MRRFHCRQRGSLPLAGEGKALICGEMLGRKGLHAGKQTHRKEALFGSILKRSRQRFNENTAFLFKNRGERLEKKG